MSDVRWQRIEEVFHHAVELAPAQRPEFLATACAGDEELRREVESLLANDDSSDNVVASAVSKAVDELPDDSASDGDDLVGKHIGPYLVTELIGKGGMGMVFKARDTQLNRSVAIKALPTGGMADAERRRRFLQEAKATSALNHPNIVTVHGITHEHGADFIVMEYVAGKTLDQLIPNKGLPLKQAVKYALEIADAVAAAHAAGIIHRDIKPSNVMITEQGRVKVLDFGLAKLAEPAHPGEQGLTEPQTTKAGMVFGTAGYMSPEQAQGKRADTRSDIFSFGALLYQMVTGRRAFPGDNVVTILAAVINQEPTPLASVVPSAPRELDWVITRCLKKDPERRIQHMVDVRIALEEALERIESPSGPIPVTPQRRIWIAPVLIAVVLGSVAGAFLSLPFVRRGPVTFQRLTFRYGDVPTAKFAPNGTIVYSAVWEGSEPTLFSTVPGNREARDLQLPSGNIQAVSRSGEMAILMGAGDTETSGTLARVPLAGGAPRPVLDNVWYADWGPSGNSLAVSRAEGNRYRVEYPIGTVLYETQALRPPIFIRVSPRDNSVAFFDYTPDSTYALNIVDSNRQRRILSRGWRTVGGCNWAPDGKEIWFGGSRSGVDEALWAVDLSGKERLLMQVGGNSFLYDVASDGRLLLANVDSRIGIRLLAQGDKEEHDLSWLDASSIADLSNDAKQMLFVELSSGDGGNPAIYLRPTNGSPAVRLGYGVRASLSFDGKWVACLRRDNDITHLLLLPTGVGEQKLLSTGAMQPESVEWFPDDKHLLVSGVEPGQPPRTYALDVSSGRITPVTQPGVRASKVSPDGRFATVISDGKLNLHSLAGGHDIFLESVPPEFTAIRWSSDGRYLFLQQSGEKRRKATLLRLDIAARRQQIWRELRLPDATSLFFDLARVSGDGKYYAFSFQRDLATVYLVKGVK